VEVGGEGGGVFGGGGGGWLGGLEEEEEVEGGELKLNKCRYNLWKVETNNAFATERCD